MTRLNLPTPARIVAIQQDNYRTRTLVLDARLEAIPGQFVMAWLPRFDEKPFSLVNDDPVTLMITAVGPFSRLVHELGIGDRLWLRGPFGNGFAVASRQRRLALVGGGYGVAPLYWLARQHLDRLEEIDVVVGARTAADLLYTDRFAKLAAEHASLTLHITTDDGSGGMQGTVITALQPIVDRQGIDGIFACGPHGMLSALTSLGRSRQIACQLSWEAYMRCGIGICGACEHEGRVLCMDGPVMNG